MTPADLLDRAERLLDVCRVEMRGGWYAAVREQIDTWKRDRAALKAEESRDMLKAIGSWYDAKEPE